ncbi:uncharacterized protein BO88DRAFT_407016 [Aspergillus vadensis CBS 113365]|uniref:Uncharacterized protein n=1 Tax=Aspergillus vadensis (strain CBS 113365 / IMI 142717 / IBT 24658) TaxID=1448311 RepID=A0A319B0E4_ASPVC|nr:hypothetical protein BO88DRAFT_407016 [Aspergillus vadensis CBS 113365]PYH66087.1 hypothetical protein BO88DRAFT_407016 [Aspergillus vadensis CBS 113365]
MYDGETLHFSRGELRPNQPTTCSSFLFLHVCRLGEDNSELVLISLPEDIIRATTPPPPPPPPETKHNG